MLTPNELRVLVADKSSKEALVVALAEYDKLHNVITTIQQTAKTLNTGKVK